MAFESRFFSLLLTLVLLGCSGCPLEPFGPDDDRLVLMSYNCQNLFDDIDQGSEYPEFDPSGGEWSTDTYLGKLAALAAAIRKAPREPDILLLQEVENSAALKRLCEDFLPMSGYDFIAAPPATGAAVQTAVASRKTVLSLKTHRAGGAEGERNILELRISAGGEELVIFNNHWKSRLGGAEATEPDRLRAALLLRRRIEELAAAEPALPVVAAGDFNEDPFETGREYPVALGASGQVYGSSPVWTVIQESDLSGPGRLLGSWPSIPEGGSYYYAGEWQRIDHFFWTAALNDGHGWEVNEFFCMDNPLLLNEYGTPLRYDPKRLEGYSDHLPLLLVLEKG
jgi:endonuclease/exonuclease/phosphatase family metal-dependent hydrolase